MGNSQQADRVVDDLTVIVPTVGRPLLEKCLQGISKGSKIPAKIIVIDQGENPEVVDWIGDLNAPGMEAIHLPSNERSPASARNAGIEQVKTSFVVAIDDDCIPEWNWLEKMESQLRKNSNSIITGLVNPAGEGIPPSITTSKIRKLTIRPNIRFHSPMTSGNMGFTLSTAKKIGPFDETLYTAEDNDWAYRALRSGIPILYDPEIIVYHYHWRDNRDMTANVLEYASGQGAFFGKHLRHGDLSMLARIAIHIFRNIRSFFRNLIDKDQFKRDVSIPRLVWFFEGIMLGFRGVESRHGK
ncbi:MAG: glycosyltransferase [Anaerolineales bacterium]|jgi:GT2 family glycosyltransferase